jgi:TRAP-type mannitol/chloroaromatic compound transport system substrate-binding protein|tara:strand:- start:5120 stop:6190 length:1071 start_codon:yes stop_codon:yes gene_type:complete
MKLIKLLVMLSISLLLLSCNKADDKNSKNINKESKNISIKMAAAFPSSLIILGETGIKLTKKINDISGGAINIKYFEPGALVPAMEIFDAVSSGSVDAGWASPAFWAGKVPALQFFTTYPFGPNPSEYIAWLRYGGGNLIFQEIYHKYNIHSIHCMAISPEGSGWFREEIKSVADLKGLRMRFLGLGAKVMEKLGVSTQLLAGGDIYPALELGTIDATEYGMPAMDLELGFHEIANNYYFPGWHQPASLGDLMINLDLWNSLSLSQKTQIEVTCGEMFLDSLAKSEAVQVEAINKLKELGVKIHQWSPEMMSLFKKNWLIVVEEEASKNSEFKRVWSSLKTFRENYSIWHDLGYVN